MQNKKRTAVLISGNGGNLQALIDASTQLKDYPAKICLVISNKPEAYGLIRAKKAGIKNLCIDHKNFKTREEFDEEVHKQLIAEKIEIVCLAGFMRILSGEFVNKWQGRMLNIHPSLLPLFKGANGVRDALAAGASTSGCTVHMVIPELDSGEIIVQRSIDILPNDTEDTLAQRIHQQEHIAYPEALQILAEKLR
ncbi:MAG TPA: phosphoribosylglycinamide formyltransferase [Alphaproteobacteria bacterium]|nr:phosphoribosylglycinamide formyltransferase [Alphaproteobacteria bacterium]